MKKKIINSVNQKEPKANIWKIFASMKSPLKRKILLVIAGASAPFLSAFIFAALLPVVNMTAYGEASQRFKYVYLSFAKGTFSYLLAEACKYLLTPEAIFLGAVGGVVLSIREGFD
jgi:hypothetical protein